MILKENDQKIRLVEPRKTKIKYYLLLIISIWLFFLFCQSFYVIIMEKGLSLGSTLSNVLIQLTFFIGGNIIFIIFTTLAIYGALRNLLKFKMITFDKSILEIVFLQKNGLFRDEQIKRILFSEIKGISVEQEEDGIFCSLYMHQNDNKISIDSDYEAEGMDRLNLSAKKIHNFMGIDIPLKEGIYEDIYEPEEEEHAEPSNNKNTKNQNSSQTNLILL